MSLKKSQIVEQVQGVVETWFGNMADPVNGHEYKVLHLIPPTGEKPGVLYLEFEPRDQFIDLLPQRFMVEISARAIPR